jgi:hypothetical protein
MRFGLAVCVVAVLGSAACDAPWAGPSLPADAHWVTYTDAGFGPVGCGPGNSIIAATTLDDLRQRVIAACPRRAGCSEPAGSCLQGLADQSGSVYLAVLLTPYCTQPTKQSIAESATAIYFVEWVGHPQGVCNLMLAQPPYRFYVVPRSGLPAGPVKVELQIQTEGQGTTVIESQVELS